MIKKKKKILQLLARWVPSSERARLGTFAYAGAQIGTVITMPISGWLASSKFGWPSIFYLFGATGVAWTLLFFIFGSDRPSESSIDRDELLFIEESLGKSQNNTGVRITIFYKKKKKLKLNDKRRKRFNS